MRENAPDPIERRRTCISPGMRPSYDRPVHGVSARGVWITEYDRTELLDAYDNVALSDTQGPKS